MSDFWSKVGEIGKKAYDSMNEYAEKQMEDYDRYSNDENLEYLTDTQLKERMRTAMRGKKYGRAKAYEEEYHRRHG